MLDQLKSWFGFGSLSDEQFERQRLALLTKTPVPVFWLFGKTGSGKSSIVRYITGATQAEVGNGFRPQTKTSAQYDFPSSDQPIVRFLDTRGLGEAGYDPTEDLDAFDDSTDVIVVVARVMDHALAEVLEPLKQIRAARPTRPVVLVLTCLHEAYPFEQHPDP
ncbi:MAG: 50S ribosome-binding GTPase, partial [Candidatus Saccharimonas sp.]|nr:50S ribosome-binding GTPase [Planctomycetaceae bacterium]